MKAVQYVSPGHVTVVDVPVPERPAGEVLLRLDKVAICGSDLHMLYDSAPASFPFAPGVSGHECIGVVEEADSTEVRRGERMLIIPPKINAMAEYVTVEPKWLIPIPDGLDSQRGVLAQLLGTVLYACKRLPSVVDKTVAVVGQGPVGLFFTMLMAHYGAKKIIGLDVVDHRLSVSRAVGAAHTINAERENRAEAVRELTDGALVDLVIEAVGKEETINYSLDLVRQNGDMLLFGIPKRSAFVFEYEKFLRKLLRTTSCAFTQQEPGLRSFRLAVDLIAQGRLDVSPLISHCLPLADAPGAFYLAQTKQDGAVKVLLDCWLDA